MNKRSKIIISVNCILAVIVIVSQFYLINFYSNNLPWFITVLNFFSLIAYFIMLFIVILLLNIIL